MRPTLNPAAAALVAAGVFIGGATVTYLYEHPLVAPASAAPAAQAPAGGAPQPALPDFSAIARGGGPAVVNISVESTLETVTPELEGAPSARPFSRGRPRGRVPVHGEGSGFIVNPDGIILTDEHVVHGASAVVVKLTDRREFRARVLGADPRTDIAVLKIDAKNLPTVTLGDPASVRPGDWVVAIGSPFGFTNSVTAGIVSAKGRSLPGDGHVPFIQTDVAVNPGNSGGPLFNLAGEVIGINSQIYSETGGYQGLAFAIPIDVAQRVAREILATGHATHARLGVIIQEVGQALAESFGLERAGGALVTRVDPNSPAASAGLAAGDIVLRYNGQPIVDSGDLPSLVDSGKPGQRATLEIWRRGSRHEVTATLGEQVAAAAGRAPALAEASHGELGLTVRPLTPQERRATGLTSGVLVESAQGPAARAGIRPGDVVLAVNDTPVKSVSELRAVTGKAGRTVALLVQRGDARAFVPLDIG